MTDDHIDRTIVQPAATHARDRHMHHMLWLAGALLLAGVVTLFALWLSQRTQLSDVVQRADTNASVSRQLADQVRSLGGTPVVQPVAGPAGVPGAAGATGATGASGVQGPQGVPGQKGDTGAPGPTGPAGVQGAAGQDGTDGTNGQAGATGVAGPQGPQGEAGPAGPQGPQGEQGPPGPTCPDGYTAQARKQGTETWWVCVADETTTPTETP